MRTVLGLFIGWVSYLSVAWGQTKLSDVQAITDPRGPAELVACSQNLKNYGTYAVARIRTPSLTSEEHAAKRDALVRRFIKAECDVIAVQEVVGKEEQIAMQGLEELAKALRSSSGRIFEGVVGPTNDLSVRNGFLVAKDRAEILNTLSYSKVELPKISAEQKPRLFPRGPLELQLLVKPKGDSVAKTVALVTFHFKSQAGGIDDPTGLQWETYRMEMAEALRRVVESRFGQAFASGETLLVLLGDRNGNFDSASAKILEGSLVLKMFQESAPCRLSKRGVPLCVTGTPFPKKLFSVLTSDPQTKNLPGTFHFRKKYSWLDEILVPAETLSFARASAYEEGDVDSGVLYDSKQASDHALVWVRFNW